MINPVSSTTQLQAPTESTPPPPKPAPYTVQDKVTLSSVGGDKDQDGDSK